MNPSGKNFFYQKFLIFSKTNFEKYATTISENMYEIPFHKYKILARNKRVTAKRLKNKTTL
jgi:hypothetical protein